MTITEMRERADKTLKFFLEKMPDAPFGEDDIIFDFAPPTRMFAKYKALCAEYRPGAVILPEHEEQLANGIGGQAVIGEGKSAVLICTKQPYLKAYLRRIIFHELMHIFCAKTEVDGEHFIDIYGSGSPYDESDDVLRDGYFLWSEFIADYYADLHTQKGRFTFESIRDDVLNALDKSVVVPMDNRRDIGWACLRLLTVHDSDSVIKRITEPDFIFPGDSPQAQNLRNCLSDCVLLLHRQMQSEKPWKITRGFIEVLGDTYLLFESCNTFYQYEQMGGIENALRPYVEQMETAYDGVNEAD